MRFRGGGGFAVHQPGAPVHCCLVSPHHLMPAWPGDKAAPHWQSWSVGALALDPSLRTATHRGWSSRVGVPHSELRPPAEFLEKFRKAIWGVGAGCRFLPFPSAFWGYTHTQSPTGLTRTLPSGQILPNRGPGLGAVRPAPLVGEPARRTPPCTFPRIAL